MKNLDIFLELEKQYPDRNAGSPGLDQARGAVKERAAALGIDTAVQKIPVFNFHISLLVYIIGSLAIIDLGYFLPWAGFGAALVFYGLLVSELTRPTFARIKSIPEKNLVLTVEARSKETQRVLVVTDLGTDSFVEPPPKGPIRTYLMVILVLGLVKVIALGLNCLFSHKYMILVALAMVLGITYLKIFGRSSGPGRENTSLSNAAVMMELAQILAKSSPIRTSVKFLFTASGSLNSGVLKVADLLDSRLSFNYVIELINQPDRRINIVTADGLLPTIKNHPLLVELFMEIARIKNIPVQEIKLGRITAVNTLKNKELHPYTEGNALKVKKIDTITLTNPLDGYTGADPQKDLRELIMGLIRKIDHPE